MKIILLRHGDPIFTASWLRTADDAKRALELYSASRVTNLPRAIDSASLIGFKKCKPIALFNECELPHPNRLYLPLPWGLFVTIYRLFWFMGFNKNCQGKARDHARAREASEYLTDLASRNIAVLLVGHGIMNRLIYAELKKSGWDLDAKTGNGYWSTISLSRKPL